MFSDTYFVIFTITNLNTFDKLLDIQRSHVIVNENDGGRRVVKFQFQKFE